MCPRPAKSSGSCALRVYAHPVLRSVLPFQKIHDRRVMQQELTKLRKRQAQLRKESPENHRLEQQLSKVRKEIKMLKEKEAAATAERDSLLERIGQPSSTPGSSPTKDTSTDGIITPAAAKTSARRNGGDELPTAATGASRQATGLYLERATLQTRVRELSGLAEQRQREIEDFMNRESELLLEAQSALESRVCDLLVKNMFFGRRFIMQEAFRHMRLVLYRFTKSRESLSVFLTYHNRRRLSMLGISMGTWRCFCVYQSPALEQYKLQVKDVNIKHTKWKDLRAEKDRLEHQVNQLKGQKRRLGQIVKGVKDGESYDIAEKDMRIRSSLMKKECERSSAYNKAVEQKNSKLRADLAQKEADIKELAEKNKQLHEKAKLLRDSEVRNNIAQDEVRRLRAVETKYSNHMRRMFLRRVSSFIGGSENRFALAAMNQVSP